MMDKLKKYSGAVYGKSSYDSSVLKDVFLHGDTHADMSIFPVKSKEPIVSYDTHSMIELWKVCYIKYAAVDMPCFVSNDYYFFTYAEAYNWYMRYMSYLDTLYARGVIADYQMHLEKMF